RAIILIVLIFTPFGHPTGVHFIFLTNGPWEFQVELQSAMSELYLQKTHFGSTLYSPIKATFK
ncbi:hypothetical protein, partial [Streptococcus suis]|uniref:hypothetical protein n=1 Tax=Streptococcus suis TaxID=1307 RepID=UPI001EDD892B